MGYVLLYGGFTLAGILFVAAGVLFFHYRIPLVISYFARWKRPQSGLTSAVTAAQRTDSAKKPAKEAGRASPKIQSGGMTQEDVTTLLGRREDIVIQGATEVLDRTQLLPRMKREKSMR